LGGKHSQNPFSEELPPKRLSRCKLNETPCPTKRNIKNFGGNRKVYELQKIRSWGNGGREHDLRATGKEKMSA